MKPALELANEILEANPAPVKIESLKKSLIARFNNEVLADIIIKKAINEGNVRLERDKIRFIKKFSISPKQNNVTLCLSFPPFEQVALKKLLEINRITDILTIEMVFRYLITNSNRVLKICSPFFQMDGWKKFEREILYFLSKGGKILILSRELRDSFGRNKEIKRLIASLRLKGFDSQIEIREYHFKKWRVESSTHAKLVISDTLEAYVGSGELRKNSFDVNFEMGVLLKGEIVKDVERLFDFMYNNSKIINFRND